MATLGRSPGAAPLTSADIPDNSITAAKIVADTIAAGDLAPNSVDSSELVDGSIDTSHIADDQVTGAKLANDIAISTTGAITTTGAFTSIGIDDNADANTIKIDANENVGIGVTPRTDWVSTRTGLQIGPRSVLWGESNNNNTLLSHNVYETSSGYAGIANGPSTFFLMSAGEMNYRNGTNSAGAGGAVTMSTRLAINAAGAVTMPSQPAFLAMSSPTQTSVSSGATVVFGTERFDLQSNYASNTFTAPITGKYHFDWMCSIQDINTGEAWYYLTLVTSNETFIYSNIVDPDMYSGGSTRNYIPFQGALTVDMDANDTAIIRINWASGGSWSGYIRDYRWFSGYLVC